MTASELREYQRRWRQENRAKVREYSRKWREAHRKEISSYYADWYAQNGRARSSNSRAVLEWKRKYPERVQAHREVASALKYGELTKPEKCSLCGRKGTVVAHHDDYAHPLQVRWVCDPCHARIHGSAKRKKKGTTSSGDRN